MCIAIVKTKGNDMPIEHLENGWKANNDGAGFAYVDASGEIVIETFMKWEEFLPKYQEAVNLYGQTSDFLIHFRITSKGATTLANCHPFRVDKDRAIIHNGTMTNIFIDKKDTRSDTKIFAEDFLPHLPEDWEDNWVITSLIENFIGWSKVCMLHRTKGIYIFNEERGDWVNKNWYSNESYKTRTVSYYTGYYTNATKGFYSYKLKKWISDDDALTYSATERASHCDWDLWNKSPYDKETMQLWKRCDCCGDLYLEQELFEFVHASSKKEMLCIECHAKKEDKSDGTHCDFCGKEFPEAELDEYWDYENGACLTVCDTCAELRHATGTLPTKVSETTERRLVVCE